MAKPLKIKSNSRKIYRRDLKNIPRLPSLASTIDDSPLADYFLAYADAGCIYVTHQADAMRLYQMGFFGKGSLSRGPLDFHLYQYCSVREEEKGYKVISKRRYEQHKFWKKTSLNLEEECTQEKPTDLRGFMSTGTSTTVRKQPTRLEKLETVHNIIPQPNTVTVDEIVNYVIPTSTCEAVDPWETAAGDSDFWGDPDEVTECNVLSYAVKHENSSPKLPSESTIQEAGKSCSWSTSNGDAGFWDNSPSASSENPRKQRKRNRRSTSTSSDKSSSELSTVQPTLLTMSEKNTESEKGFSDSDSENGDTLVMDDSLTENESDSETEPQKKRWKTCLKTDPCPLKENLQLSPEETLFLTYGLGCLVVQDLKTRNKLNISELWNIFRAQDSNFIPRYIAYHYYRSKGWVLKNGLKYGADFILYKKGPPFFHSSFSIVIKPVVERGLERDSLFLTPATSWRSLACVDRVIDTVAKEVLYCYVVRPEHMTAADLESPLCIPRFKVCEMHLKRWVSKEQRDEIRTS